MGVAVLSAKRSKDPARQMGACIVNSDRKIIGIGYTGFPTGCPDTDLPWSGREVLHDTGNEGIGSMTLDMLDTKYPYLCHAELNAIVNCNITNLRGLQNRACFGIMDGLKWSNMH